MADDMIERVARRLWDHSFDRMPDPPWEQTTELQKMFNRMLAREAIAEMREPTEAMLVSARDWSYAKYGKPIGNEAAAGCWLAMHDGALPAAPKQPGAT